ncbi:MAG: amidase, partial [Anaerolineae bacterium]|nr:amidase [Anaerolineae bacterium]
MSYSTELSALDATAQAELVRRGEVRPTELAEAAIERIERLNPRLNAVVTTLYDQGLAASQGDLPDGPFRGVPFLLKDLGMSYAGARLTSGSAFLKDYVPDHDSTLVTRFKQAGLVILGKTNTPEFGILPTTESHLLGPARNPWNMGHSTGGSSGGAAAAVAARLVPFAHASDGGGSIRIPAACCGLVGLKPTRARTPLGPDVGDMMNGLVCDHAVTRSVRDCAALLDAVAGPDLGDPYWAPPLARPLSQEVGAPTGRLRIAITTQPLTGMPVHPDCMAAVEDAARLCADLGHHVEEAAPALNGDQVTQSFIAVWTAGVAWSIEGMAYATGRKPTADQFEPLTWGLYQMGRSHTAPTYLLAVTALQQAGRQLARFMQTYDVWLTPTVASPPPPLGHFDSPPDNPRR